MFANVRYLNYYHVQLIYLQVYSRIGQITIDWTASGGVHTL